MCSQAAKRAVNALAVINKCDMPQIADIKRIEGALGRVCLVSAKEGIGLDSIRRAVEEIFGENIPKPDGSVLTNLRQHTAAKNALSALDNALNALSAGQTPDAVLSDASRLWRLWAR
jgi:tRNA U34 5-carboxymethylaminomethyl modifying GTPase MnmE/TrmE